MSTIEKWLTGVTALAVVATIVSNRNSPAVIKNIFGGVAGVYSAAKKG